MEIAHILKTLWRQRVWVAVGVIAALGLAWATTFKVSFPPTTESKSIEYGSAWTQILVDARRSPLFDLESSIDPVASRAEIYVRLVDSEPVRATIAREARLAPHEIVLSARTPTFSTTRAAREPASEQRSRQIATEGHPRRVLFAAEENVPMISVFTEASTPEEATALADASARGLIRYLESLDAHRSTPRSRRIEFRQLGSAQGELVNPGASSAMAAMVFLVLFSLWCIGVLVCANLAAALRATGAARTCGDCGCVLDDGAQFCSECGCEQLAEGDGAPRRHPEDAAPQTVPGPRPA